MPFYRANVYAYSMTTKNTQPTTAGQLIAGDAIVTPNGKICFVRSILARGNGRTRVSINGKLYTWDNTKPFVIRKRDI